MKYISVSDIHLYLKDNKEWESKRFLQLFLDIRDFVRDRKINKVVLAGDIFHKAKPTLEEIDLFYKAISSLEMDKEDIIVLAGNHEEVQKPLYTFDYLPDSGFTYLKEHKITHNNTDIYFVSHSNLGSLKDICDGLRDRKNVLFTHVRCDVPPHIKEEYPLYRVAKSFDLVISGDIHFPWEVYDTIKYAGTPYSHSYKADVVHGFFVVALDTLEVDHIPTHYPNKIKISLPYSKIKKVTQLPKENLYMVQVRGTIEELDKLPQVDNVLYEKLVTTEDVGTLEDIITLEEITDKDVVRNLVKLTKKTYNLSDDVVEEGERILRGIF